MNGNEIERSPEKPPTSLTVVEGMIRKADAENLTDLERHVFEMYLGMFLLKQEITYNALYMKGSEGPVDASKLSDDGNNILEEAIESLENKGVIPKIAQ